MLTMGRIGYCIPIDQMSCERKRFDKGANVLHPAYFAISVTFPFLGKLLWFLIFFCISIFFCFSQVSVENLTVCIWSLEMDFFPVW